MLRPQTKAARRILISAFLAAFLLAASAGRAGPWPFALFFLVARPTRIHWRLTPLDLPLLVFLSAALIGVWAAYDHGLALQKLWMLLGAYLLFYAIAVQPPQNLWTVVASLAGLSCTVAIVFLFTTDWQTYPPEFAFARPLLQNWASLRPSLNLRGMHPNVAGGLIALLFPFQLIWIRHLRQEPRRPQRYFMLAGLVLTVLALLLSSSRGAILSLVASLTLWTLLHQFARLSPAPQRKVRLFITLLAGAMVVISSIIIAVWHSQVPRLLTRLPLGDTLVERASLVKQTMDLITDFPVIGGGLASFPGLYSRYILGIPYFYLPNGHNILLDLFLEQGFLGGVSFIVIAITTGWLLLRLVLSQESTIDSGARLLAGASFSSFVILLLHGMVENTVYGSVGLPLLLSTPAIAMVLNRTIKDTDATWQKKPPRVNTRVLAACGTLLIVSLLLPGSRALWLTNLASIHMARVELSHFPGGRWQDDSDIARLTSAQRMFEHSIRLDERQNTAHYRLGLIAMLHRDYEEAVRQLQIAYQNNNDHIGIRKALGYSYAWSGNVEQGIVLLSQVPFVNQDLRAYKEWWRSQGRSDLGLIAVQLQERIPEAGQDNPGE